MSDSALQYLNNSGGFELGTGPSIAILDVGAARALTTSTLQNDIYAVFFDQRGLMAGLGRQGPKITRIHRRGENRAASAGQAAAVARTRAPRVPSREPGP